MLLVNPTTVAELIRATCGGRTPAGDDKDLYAVLRYLTPRVESALNVDSLSRGVFTDTFFLPSQGSSGRPLGLRLSNGFIVPDSIQVLDASGNEVSADSRDLLGDDLENGVVSVASWARGRCIVKYESGFEIADLPTPAPEWMTPDDRILVGVPDWMVSVITHFLVLLYRTARAAPTVNEKISYGQVDLAIRRELHARIYERYMRPRVGLIFSDRLTRG